MSFSKCSIKPLALIAALGLIAACSRSDNQPGVAADTTMDSLVTAEWLSEHLNDPNLVVLDCTVLVQPGEDGGFSIVSGRANYEEGHIPTAGFADLMGDLSDGESPFQFVSATEDGWETVHYGDFTDGEFDFAFTVPAPGAFALLSLAGLMGSPRRRRA